jgi:hypothetical protein
MKVLPMETPEDEDDEGLEPFREIAHSDDVRKAEVTAS